MDERTALLQEQAHLYELMDSPGYARFVQMYHVQKQRLIGQLQCADPNNVGGMGKLQGIVAGMEEAMALIPNRLAEIDRTLGRKEP